MAGQSFTINIKALFDASDVKAKVSDIQNAFKNIKLPDNLQKNFTSSFDSLNKALTDFETRAAKGIKTKADAKGLTGSMDNVIKEFTKVQSVVDKIRSELGTSIDLSKAIKLDDATLNKLNSLKQQIADIQKQLSSVNANKITALEASLKQIKSGSGASKQGQAALELFKAGDVQGAIDALDKIIAKLQVYAKTAENAHKDTTNVENSIKQLDAMRTTMQGAQNESASLIAQQNAAATESAQILSDAQAKVVNQVDQAANSLSNYGNQARSASSDVSNMANNQARLNTELDQVKSRIQYFFGLSNAINLVRRAVRGAVETVKELDAAMTETAVVTNYTVKDMWDQLPEYTKRANELGVMTKDAYESATLYFQQGLNADQAAALSTETLKMARIAGLDAAEATDRMTNALRGFNMELDTASAQRVDDVYSELAAISASDVDEISTAMTKVASLAHSANMEFETTAAFLAQIIETTRESAETAGTALKTVVARFSEVKKLVDTNQLKGTDEEGQVVDVNKVSAALRTAGIDLNKYFLGEVGLDDIFIELASKWDSLTSVQQRYIATQAAGSRQQSRFIALMQDYARTQELVGAAYNAEGASARQFEKTQDSLQSKLARLKNAWNEFLMGITNSGVIKGVVDVLTTLLNIINKITGAFGPATSGFLKFGVAAATIFAGKKAFSNGGLAEKVLGSLGNGPLGTFLGLGGNTTQITSAGTAFHGEVVSAGAEFAAAVRGAAGVEAATGGTGVGPTLRLTPREALKQFKANSLRPNANAEAYNAYAQMAQEYMALNPGAKNPYAAEMAYYNAAAPKTLFGALGNRFLGTGAGKATAGILGKLGFGGAAGAAGVSGAAALAAALGTVTVAAAAAGVAIKKAYDASPKGQVKIAEKYASAISNAADSARRTAASFREAQERVKSYEDSIKSAGSLSEQQSVIQDQNEYLLSLMEKDSTYAQYVKTSFTEGGQLYLTIEPNAFAEAIDKINEATTKSTAYSNLGQAILNQQQIDLYRSKLAGVDLEKGTKTVGQYDIETQLSATELNLYRSYQAQIDSATAAMQNQATMAMAGLIKTTGTDLGDNITSSLATVLGSTLNADKLMAEQVKQRRENWWAGNATDDMIRAEYLRLFGSELQAGYDKDEAKNAIALAQVVEEQFGELIPSLLGELGSNEALQSIFSAAGGINLKDSAITVEMTDQGLADFFESLGYSEEQLDAFGKEVGLDTNKIKDSIKQQRNFEKLRQENLRKEIGDTLGQHGVFNQAATLKNLTGNQLDQYSALQQAAEGKITEEDYSNFALEQLKNVQSNAKAAEDALKFLSSFDLDNVFTSLEALSKEQRTNAHGMRDYATSIRDANKDLFSTSNLLSELAKTDAFDDLSKEIDTLREKNGRVSSQDVEGLIESYQDLQTIVDETGLSIENLTSILNATGGSADNFAILNDSLIELISNSSSFEGILDQITNTINNFDPGRDYGEGVDFLTSQLEKLQEYADNNEYGNEAMQNIYKMMFGQEAFEKAWNSEDPYSLVQGQLAKMGKWLEDDAYNFFGDEGIMKSLGIEDLGNFELKWGDIEAKNLTSKEAVAEIMRAARENGLEISEEAAQMFLEAFASHSLDLQNALEINDLTSNINTMLTALGDGFNTNGLRGITDQQIQLLANAWHTDADILREAISRFSPDLLLSDIQEWTPDKILQHLTGGSSLADWLQNEFNFEGTELDKDIELDIQAKLGEAGISPEDIQAFIDDIKQKLADGASLTDIEIGGIKVSSESAEIDTSDVEDITKTVKVQTEGTEEAKSDLQTINDLTTQTPSETSTTVNAPGTPEATEEVKKYNEEVEKIKESASTTISVPGAADALAQVQNLNRELSALPLEKRISIYETTYKSTEQAATGGVVGSWASGSGKYKLRPGVALTGEEGPEIVWNKDQGYAYITGQNQPEFQNLQPGDRIFNAQETKKILQGSLANGGTIPSYATGKWGGGGSKKSSGGGGGGGGGSGSGSDKTPEEWKNDLDWLYNLMEDIAELERDQKAIEEQYEDLLQDQTKTGKDLYNLLIQQLGNLYTQLNHQTFALEKREQEMREFMDVTNDQDQYLWYNWQDRTLEIDWDAIDKITDEEQYKHVKELIDEAEEIQDKIDDADDSIMDITNQIQELENIWRDTFTDFEDRVYDALVKSYQQVIDKYSELNDTLNNSNSQILDSLQKQISLERQIRDNTKTEEEITDDEARLAYLRRDTSGGNELAALQLERELADQRESYEDTLVDQAISRLQEDNDAAAQQRQQQIDIMQAQLDYQSQNGEFNAAVRELLETAMGADGELLTNSDLANLLKEQENWAAMSDVSKTVWEEELNGTFKEVAAFLLKENAEQNGTFYTALTAAVNSVSSAIGSYSQAMVKLGNSISSAGSSGGGGGGGSTPSGPPKSPQSKSVYHTVYRVVNGTPKYYATGGLNTQTGPAWLDGTPSEPEYVLNARQTDAFLKLADVLPSMMSTNTTGAQANTFGSTYVNLSVNLDSVSPEYDVDRMVDILKDRLYDAGSYRNVNSLSFIR